MKPDAPTTALALPDAEQMLARLQEAVQTAMSASAAPVYVLGIHSGGAWVAERLAQALPLLAGRVGSISSSMYRDDFAKRGLAHSLPTDIAFDINEAHIILIDDVLHTGRTIRAVLNELFDYGRPARVQLMVLADRAGRQLPFAADFAAAQVDLPVQASLHLSQSADGRLQFSLKNREASHAE